MRQLVRGGRRRGGHLPIGCDHSRHLPITSDHFPVQFVPIRPHVTDKKMPLRRWDVGLAALCRKGEVPVGPTIKMVSISGPHAGKVGVASSAPRKAAQRACPKGERWPPVHEVADRLTSPTPSAGRGDARGCPQGKRGARWCSRRVVRGRLQAPTERGRHTTSPARPTWRSHD
jgi:hypothetical protein